MHKNYQTIILTLVALCLAGVCFAQDETPSPTLEQGIAAYKHENFEEALVLLKKAKEEGPTSSLCSYYLGLTYKQTQDYRNAIQPLRDAVTVTPKIKGALIELIDCLYQLGELDEALTWIAEAEKEGIRPAQTSFLKGLVLMKKGDAAAAVDAFENAKGLDKSMAQACDYQIGVCYLKDSRFQEARQVFNDVVLADPNSTMANFANEYVSALERKKEAEKPFRMSAGFAWQYDDNVILKPSDETLSGGISNNADSREVYTVKAEYTRRFNELFSAKAQYSFYYAKQNDLGFYDVVSNGVVIQPNVTFKNSQISFPTGYTHTYVDDQPYLSSPHTSGIYNIMIGKSQMAQAFIKYQYHDYLWEPSGDQDDRDGHDLGGGCGWYIFYAKNKGFVSIRYTLNRDFTKGDNWDYIGNRVSAACLIPVIEKLNLTLSGDIFDQRFLNPNALFGEKRSDTVYTASSMIAYKFYKDSEVQLQYTFITDRSSLNLYQYDRNVYSAGVEIKF